MFFIGGFDRIGPAVNRQNKNNKNRNILNVILTRSFYFVNELYL